MSYLIDNQSLYLFPPISDKNFPIYIDKQKHYNKKELFRTHWHEHFEIILVDNGELALTCNGRTYNAKKGDMLIINPNDVHYLEGKADFIDYYCIVFDFSLIKTAINDISDNNLITPLSKNQLLFNNKSAYTKEVFNWAINIFKKYDSKNITKYFEIKAYVFLLLSYIFNTCEYTLLNTTTFNTRSSNLSIIQNIIIYLNHNYYNEIDLKKLAFKFNISYHYLCHLFKEYTNKTIIEYVTSVRMEKAAIYLKNSDKSISEISELVGYNDANYFSRVFKKNMKVSPKNYN